MVGIVGTENFLCGTSIVTSFCPRVEDVGYGVSWADKLFFSIFGHLLLVFSLIFTEVFVVLSLNLFFGFVEPFY